MLIGERLHQLRIERQLTQRDIERRTGLRCCYTSRVENGHTVPSLETLERMARALEVPLYRLFYEGTEPPAPSNFIRRPMAEERQWGSSGKNARLLRKFCCFLARLDEADRKLLIQTARKMAAR